MSLMLLLTCCNFAIQATTYYISNSGSDSNDGLSSGEPWQTISKVNTTALFPGDSVLFRCGDVFRETLDNASDGTSNNPIVFSSYGLGVKPIFSLPLLTGWTDLGNGVFRVAMPTSTFTGVWEDYIPVQPRASSTALLDGRWYEDGSHLFYRPQSGHPSNHEVGAVRVISDYDSGMRVSDRRFLTICNISFRGVPAGVFSLDTGSGTEGIIIRGCDFQYCHSAVFLLPNLSNNRNTVIDNNQFFRNHNAIRMYTASAISGPQIKGENLGCKITDNNMFENGTIDGSTPWDYGFTDFEAIGLQNFSNGVIMNNHIHHNFALGIIFYNFAGKGSDNNFIAKNYLQSNSKTPFHITGENANTTADYSFGGNTISHNIFSNNTSISLDPAIWINQGNMTAVTNYFVNNTCIGQYQQIQITRSDIPVYLTIRNNIFYDVDYNIWVYGDANPTELSLDHNLYYSEPQAWGWFIHGSTKDLTYIQGLGYELNGLVSDPLFREKGNDDYRLIQNSPGVELGIPTPGVAEDYEGIALGANPNAGVFEIESCTPGTNTLQEIGLHQLDYDYLDQGTSGYFVDDRYAVQLNISNVNGSLSTTYTLLLNGKIHSVEDSGQLSMISIPAIGSTQHLAFMDQQSGGCMQINALTIPLFKNP